MTARTTPLQSSFSFGEFSPWLVARTNFDKYPGALSVCLNAVPLIEGGYMRRPGTRYVAEVKDSSVATRLKKFQFSVQQSHTLEFGAGYFRFFRFQGALSAADTDATIANGTFTTDLTSWNDKSTGTGSIQQADTALELTGAGSSNVGWAEQTVAVGASYQSTVHVLKFRVKKAGKTVAGDTVQVRVGTTTTGTELVDDKVRGTGYHCIPITLAADATIYIGFRNIAAKAVLVDDVSLLDNATIEIDNPYAAGDLFEVEGPQSADVLYQFHETYPPHKLERFANNEWSFTEVAWKDGPYLSENTTATTMTPSATTGLGKTMTASAITGVNDGAGFKTTDVGRLIRFDGSGSAWGYARITGWTSTTVVTIDVITDFSDTVADTRWQLGSWSDTTGWPKAATFFEQRLITAGTNEQPQTFWGSKSAADFENQEPTDADGTVADDHAFDFTISSGQVNPIIWMAEQRNLVIATNGGEWIVSSDGVVITPTDVTVKRQSSIGVDRIAPVNPQGRLLFVQRAGRELVEYGYNFDDDAFQGLDKTRLARHITTGGLIELAYAQQPHKLILAPRADGTLLSLTYNRREQVEGWSRHVFGGSLEASFSRVWQVDTSVPTYTDETTDAGDSDDADWTLFPATEATGDYAAFGYTQPFSKVVFDYANGTAGVAGAVDWEYWDGGEWIELASVTDNTTGFTATAADDLSVSWTMPADWGVRSIGGSSPLYYVRAKITTVYTTNPVLDQGFVHGPAICRSVTTIPGQNNSGQTHDSTDRDEVWVIVERTINNSTKKYIEFWERDFELGQDQEDAYYMDSLLTYDSTSTTSITGADHLDGESVAIWANGAIQASKTVSSGAFTMDESASVVQAGLAYTHTMKTLKLDFGASAGTAQGQKKRVDSVMFALLSSHTLKYGPTTGNIDTTDFRVVGNPMDAGAPLFTGEWHVDFEGDWDDDSRILVQSSDPAPFTLLAIAPDLQTSELT